MAWNLYSGCKKDLNRYTSRELQKIRHTFKINTEPGRRMFSDWNKGQECHFPDVAPLVASRSENKKPET